MKHITHFTLAATVAVGSAGMASAQNYGMAVSGPGSLFHNIGSAIASAANDAGVNVTIQPSTSTNQYIPLVGSGGIEFGAANLQEVAYALEGQEWFEGQEYPDLRIVASIMPLREAIFVRADSDIRTIADLEGERMVDGYTAQQTILPQLDAMYATAGLTRDDMIPVNVPSVVGGADAFIAGESVGFIFAHGAGKVREADAAVGGLYAIPIEPTDENLAAVREHWPVGFFTEIEAGTTPGVTETAHYVAYPQVIFTHANAPEEAVYEMAKVIYENQEAFAASFPPFNQFDPDEMNADTAGVEYHAGALRFFEEMGLN